MVFSYLTRAQLFLNTVRYLKWRQIFFRIRRLFLLRHTLILESETSTRRKFGPMVSVCERDITFLAENRVRYLNYEVDISGVGIWNDDSKDKLWLYNLHYFDDLNAKNATQRVDWHCRLISRWIGENPLNHGSGWEAYPTSLRIVNWIKWDLREEKLVGLAKNSLAVQARWLRQNLEYHLLGNHLLANAKALIFAGLYFEGSEAQEWLSKGESILCEQVSEQILGDGGHFELSPMYHSIILEDLLDIVNVCRVYNHPVPDLLYEVVPKMLVWIGVMCHPDGEIPFFNDAAMGIAIRPTGLFEYAARLGFSYEDLSDSTCYLEKSGYVKLTYNTAKAVLFFDMAPIGPDYLPGHAHADTLSVELSIFGRRVLVNSGTSVYGVSKERHQQRSTALHNTVCIDGENSSEVWSGFRVARRAKVYGISLNFEEKIAVAMHDGYGRLRGKPMHRRQVRLENGALLVEDTITGRGRHEIEIIWHLHPDIDCAESDGGLRLRRSNGGAVNFADMIIEGIDNVKVEDCFWYPEFGVSISNKRIIGRVFKSLPCHIMTTLRWY